ncbi:hypothetical protein C8J57DRAFT_719297 [Mycena rebaudengoi]|nr:hypothetical protein C8J57DRAFT_719297 [Mycena rebaudengoi]
MRSAFASLLVLGSFIGATVAQLTIITPQNPVVCQPSLITWGGGQRTPLLHRTAVNNDDRTQTFENFGSPIDGTSVTWNIRVPAGTNVLLTMKDNTGATQTSAPFPILPGNADCLNSANSSAPPNTSSQSGISVSASKSISIPVPPPISPPPTSAPPSTTTKPPSSTGSNTSSAAPGSSTSQGAAPTHAPRVAAAAAALGAVFAALI